ncbi:MAG TPA: stage II sporulation protein M [Actinotalea caeni]|uniref:stage II sporulation protein M n=1 Tax=Actinotalea caeni TaxID=1348467 RepID=UPI0012E14488|nr:stage II sporulation protein M [Actinotalea caeni]HLV54291.1 stage II sporulation protein M [Actinotalea caeni]
MDVDAFVAVRSARWERLAQLTRQRHLSGPEADELVALYQATATDYSRVRTSAPDPALISRLSALLGRGRSLVAGAHEPAWSDVVRFFVVSVPAAFYRVRWWTVATMVAFLVVGVVSGWWTYSHPELLAEVGTFSERQQYAERAFEAYYSEHPAGDFATMVWTNNAWIAARAIGLGITGIGPIYLLVMNALSVGTAGAVLAEFDMLHVFFGLILPHGLLELTSIFVACAAGLKIFWTWVRPGPRTRSRALAEEGRAMVTLAIGLAVVLLVCGVVEGYVTPSSLPTGVKIAIGALVLAGYWVYTLVLGRAAVRDGETGDVRREHREDTVATAD